MGNELPELPPHEFLREMAQIIETARATDSSTGETFVPGDRAHEQVMGNLVNITIKGMAKEPSAEVWRLTTAARRGSFVLAELAEALRQWADDVEREG